MSEDRAQYNLADGLEPEKEYCENRITALCSAIQGAANSGISSKEEACIVKSWAGELVRRIDDIEFHCLDSDIS